MKKRIISLILVLVLIMLPFSISLNTRATGISISVDGNNKVTNNTGTITLENVNAGTSNSALNANDSDTFKAYKVVDIYYDSSTNSISYQFTTDFARFVGTLTTAFINTITNPQKNTFEVEDYLKLTNDNMVCNQYDSEDPSVCTNEIPADTTQTTSTLNKLVSKYATYIRNNPSYYGVSNTDVKSMTNSVVNGDVQASATGVVPGAYLVLPDSVTGRTLTEGEEPFSFINASTYGVMVANVSITIDGNGDWIIVSPTIGVKSIEGGIIAEIAAYSADQYEDVEDNMVDSLNYENGNDYSLFILTAIPKVPINATDSIKALISSGELNAVDIEFPSSITPDLTEPYFFGTTAEIDNNEYNMYENQIKYKLADVTVNNNNVSFNYIIIPDKVEMFTIGLNLNVDTSSLSNNAAGNIITTTSYYVKDPYIDIGSNITSSDIRAAFDSSDANYSSNKSVTIRQAIEKMEKQTVLYTSLLNIVNKNSSNDNLSGAEFALYDSYDSTNGTYGNQIGNNIQISNGLGVLNGIDPTQTYYLKQVKAPSGYRLYNDKVIVLPGTGDSTVYDLGTYQVVTASNGVYTANVVNQAMLALPFTGGSGTAAYTLIGLLIVVGAGIFLVLYKKKNKPENKLKKLYKK